MAPKRTTGRATCRRSPPPSAPALGPIPEPRSSVMKFQRNPSRARLLELVMAASQVAIDDFSCRATGVDADERSLVESVRDELATVIGTVRHSPTGAEELTD